MSEPGARLDLIGEVFLAEYEKQAPISRQRVALWEAWSYLRNALHFLSWPSRTTAC
jgi:hypothetical protein